MHRLTNLNQPRVHTQSGYAVDIGNACERHPTIHKEYLGRHAHPRLGASQWIVGVHNHPNWLRWDG